MGLFWAIIADFLHWITFGKVRQRREILKRRAKYEFLKAQVCERHFNGYAGLVVDFKDRKFDSIDRASFRPPMYQWAMNNEGKFCVFWDRSRMTREIGTGAPLKEGEVLVVDHNGRTKPDATLETIDDQKPLTHQDEQTSSEIPKK